MQLVSKYTYLSATLLWTIGVVAGAALFMRYGTLPGVAHSSPVHWPEVSALPHRTDRANLVTFLHPRCPCSRATLSELVTLLAQCNDSVACTLIFVQPTGASEDWAKTDLWQRATSIPGTTIIVDKNGSMAERFNAQTSGHTLLYNSRGALLFSGGMTSSRGQTGVNAGSKNLLGLIQETNTKNGHTPVYGCPLFTPDTVEGTNASVKNLCSFTTQTR